MQKKLLIILSAITLLGVIYWLSGISSTGLSSSVLGEACTQASQDEKKSAYESAQVRITVIPSQITTLQSRITTLNSLITQGEKNISSLSRYIRRNCRGADQASDCDKKKSSLAKNKTDTNQQKTERTQKQKSLSGLQKELADKTTLIADYESCETALESTSLISGEVTLTEEALTTAGENTESRETDNLPEDSQEDSEKVSETPTLPPQSEETRFANTTEGVASSPSITFTVDGQKDIQIPPGKPLVFEWSSANIDTLAVSHSTNDKKKCDNAPLTNSIKGLQGIFKHSGWAKNDKFIGCTYEITVEGKQTSTGAVVRESVKMAVVAARSIPPSIVITKITTESGEVVTEGTNIVSGQNSTKLIVQYRKTNIPKNAQITPTFILKNDLTLADPKNIFVSFSVMSPAPSGEERFLITIPEGFEGDYRVRLEGFVQPQNPATPIEILFDARSEQSFTVKNGNTLKAELETSSIGQNDGLKIKFSGNINPNETIKIALVSEKIGNQLQPFALDFENFIRNKNFTLARDANLTIPQGTFARFPNGTYTLTGGSLSASFEPIVFTVENGTRISISSPTVEVLSGESMTLGVDTNIPFDTKLMYHISRDESVLSQLFVLNRSIGNHRFDVPLELRTSYVFSLHETNNKVTVKIPESFQTGDYFIKVFSQPSGQTRLAESNIIKLRVTKNPDIIASMKNQKIEVLGLNGADIHVGDREVEFVGFDIGDPQKYNVFVVHTDGTETKVSQGLVFDAKVSRGLIRKASIFQVFNDRALVAPESGYRLKFVPEKPESGLPTLFSDPFTISP